MNLDEAIKTLKLPYTYDIVRVEKEKKEKRVLVGTMAAEILEDIRDKMIEAALELWLRHKKNEQLVKEHHELQNLPKMIEMKKKGTTIK